MRAALVLAIVVTAAACATASGEVNGGDPRTEPGASDAGSDAPQVFPEDSVDAGSGSTWPDLYRDLFGPTGLASCARSTVCHGAADQAGATISGYVCADQAGCVASMTALLVRPKDATAPEKSILVTTLRHRAASGAIVGIMPKEPATFVFPRSAIERIDTWIAAGAPAN